MRTSGPGDSEPGSETSGEVSAESRGERSGVELSGVVHGPAVQARNIHGDVHIMVGQAVMPVPAQLPSATAHFTGRSGELTALDRAAAEYAPASRLAVAVISGVGGAGKTSLASHWLHRVSDRYSGGILYADLNGHLPAAARAPDEVLGGFLRALGTPSERIPLILEEQAALFRSLTSGRRMLLLLDNAASAAQVRALIPGPGPRGETGRPSFVVVTTRWRLAGLAMDGARFIELGPLDDTSAAALLTRMIGEQRAGEEAEAVHDVVRLCGGLPLAVCVAGAQLASHAWWAVRRVAAELAGEQDRLAVLSSTEDFSVRAAFDFSYQALQAPTARLYRLLSLLFSSEFGAELAAAVAGTGTREAARLLDALVEVSLLEETAERRFRFHDLVKLHAREHAGAEAPNERVAVITRAIDWYLDKAVAADIVISPIRWRLNPMYNQAREVPSAYSGSAEALQWLESELPGLLAAVRAARASELHERAWQLCEALWSLFAYRKYFREWIAAHVIGLASAQACGDRRAEARMRVQLGLAYLNLGRHEPAREEFERALALARAEGHQISEATALEQIGLVDLSRGRQDDAINWFTQARQIFRQIGEERGVLGITRHIGEAHRDAGRHEQAVRHLLEARSFFRALPDRYNEARSLTSLGQAYLAAGDPEPAARSLAEALDIMISIGGRYEQARIQMPLADALLLLGKVSQARDHLAAAFTIYSEVDAPEAAEVWRRLGEIKAGRPRKEDKRDRHAASEE